MRCGIIILAAGASTRMGRAKQSIEFHGTPLLRHAVEMALATSCRPVGVVLGADAQKLAPLLIDLPVQVAMNPDWARGMGTSIRCGLSAIPSADLDAVMILLCDQPLITAAALDRMMREFSSSGKSLAAARYAGALGTPAIFASNHFADLLALRDNQGGKTILQRYLQQVHPFQLPEAAVDLDTPEDIERWEKPI